MKLLDVYNLPAECSVLGKLYKKILLIFFHVIPNLYEIVCVPLLYIE